MASHRKRGIAIFSTGLLFGTAGAAVAYVALGFLTGRFSLSAPTIAWLNNAYPKLLIVVVPIATLWTAVFGVRRWYVKRSKA